MSRRGGFVMRADGAVWHASSTRFCSAVIKEMFMLWMMPRRGERSAQYSTPRYTTLSTILFLIRSPFPFLMSPSFFLPPLPSLARCSFGSEWQFRTAPHCSTVRQWWQASPPSNPPQPTALPLLEPQADATEKWRDMFTCRCLCKWWMGAFCNTTSIHWEIWQSLAWLCNYTHWLRLTSVCNYLIMQDYDIFGELVMCFKEEQDTN